MTTAEIAQATGGALAGASVPVAGVSTDTRDGLAGHLFVALSGERFDAHDFLGDAVGKGAAALLVSNASKAPSGVPLVVVRDTLRALGDLARAHRASLHAPVIALTGSNGKTTTKEMIAAILGVSKRVLKTEGNLNNLIGVPMTLLGMDYSHEVAVIEMGMNTPGEIARYTEIARPDVGLVINVGPAHIGMLGSIEAIASAKGELYAGLDKTRSVAVVNLDDPHVVAVARASGVARRRTFGRGEGADVRLLAYEPRHDTAGGRARYAIDGRELSLDIPIAGEHNALNAAGAIAAVTTEAGGASLEDVERGLPNLARVGRRMMLEQVGPYLLVDDCYNANSASMRAAIDTVSARGSRFVAVLGEMRELGDFSDEEHRKVGEALAAKTPALVAVLGPLARPIAEAARAGAAAGEVAYEVDDVDKLFAWLAPRLRAGDVILVKGSRGMKMERVIERIRAYAKETA